MTWVYLDDHFPDHPKVVAAGGDAAWLFVCALAYCKRYKTDGAIPRAQVAKLTDRRKPHSLAGILVNVHLWEATDTGFQVHDYDQWNRPAETRSEKGRKAAQARWHPPSNATSNANAPPEHVPQDALVPVPVPVISQSQSQLNPMSPNGASETGPQRAETETNLALLIANLCRGRNRTFVNLEAAAVVAWAERHVNRTIIEESVGWFAQQPQRPDLPRAVATLIASKAADRHVVIPPFEPRTLNRF